MMIYTYGKNTWRNDIILALMAVPLYMAGVSRYGYRLLFALAICASAGFLVEYATFRIRKIKPDRFGYPFWILFPLVLPPAFPLWMTGISAVFAVIIGVSFFGGHGKEIASPVALGWTFAALSFPAAFSFGWTYPFPALSYGFTHYSASLPTGIHPVLLFNSRADFHISRMLFGLFPQAPASAVLFVLLISGILLIVLKAVDFRSFVSFSGTMLILSVLFRILFPKSISPVSSLLTGNFLFTSFFVFPVLQTAGRTKEGRWCTGALAGAAAFLIRNFSSYPDGILFAVLFGNIFSPIIDELVLTIKYRRLVEGIS